MANITYTPFPAPSLAFSLATPSMSRVAEVENIPAGSLAFSMATPGFSPGRGFDMTAGSLAFSMGTPTVSDNKSMASDVPWRMMKGGIPPVSGHVDAVVLAASTAEEYTTKEDCYVVSFSANADFYLLVHATSDATVPSADVRTGAAAILNPLIRYVAPRTRFSLISPVACVVTIECYGRPI